MKFTLYNKRTILFLGLLLVLLQFPVIVSAMNPSDTNKKTERFFDIKINAFTPNGDGINDYFELEGLLNYPNNELLVFNRFSDRVYSKRGYSNDWAAPNVPSGLYYYLLTIHLPNGEIQKYSGKVNIIR
ncbi:MAG: gliding motility-associated C-terminal domain-containing protein [Bacteroidales bacterium]